MKLSAVIIAHNEGEEVARTVESLQAAFVGQGADKGPRCELEAIVIDDGSTDGSCAHLPESVKVVRHEQPLGVGRSRNAGYLAACGQGVSAPCDVVSFHDAHMRFEPGTVERLARKALETDAIVCAYSRGFERQSTFTGYGCDLFYNRKDGLQPKWRMYKPDEEWARVPGMMGAAYFVSRTLAERLCAPTGELWEDTAGRWGFSEQALSVKAFLMDVPILVSRDIFIRHLYRSKNKVPNAGRETWLNVAASMSALLEPETFRVRFKRYCLKHSLSEKDIDKITAETQKNQTQINIESESWKLRPDSEIFTDLCGKGAKITVPHEDHAWLPAIRDFVGATHASPLRVLQWRPGEATMLIKTMRPDAEITCIEMPGHRINNWWDVCGALGFKVQRVGLGPDYASWPLKAHRGPFDLVLIGGEMQAECRQAAGKLLAPSGKILVNESADRLQVEDMERRKEEKQLKHTTQAVPVDVVHRAPVPSVVNTSVTVLLLNWRRPENIGPILDCLAAQTAQPRIVLWNNAAAGSVKFRHGNPDDTSPMKPIEQDPRVSLVVNSSENLGCWPRWWLAGAADTEFVCSLDDDLKLADERVLEDAMSACREECPDGIVGFFGWSQVVGKDYRRGRHHNGTTTGTKCDVIKGRFMLLRRELLARVPLVHPATGGLEEDDIVISLAVSRGRPNCHRIPARLGKRWREVGRQDGRARASRPDHYQRREKYVRALLDYYRGRDKTVAAQKEKI